MVMLRSGRWRTSRLSIRSPRSSIWRLNLHSFGNSSRRTASLRWWPIEQLPTLEDRFHDDHFHMLDHFLKFMP